MRTNKTGSELELVVMSSVSKTLRKLPGEMRNRIVNWLAAQDWSDEPQTKPTVQPASAALS